MRELRERVAVVTGAASGIGLGLARRFAAEGMKVVLADIEPAALDAAVEELRASGGSVVGAIADVSRIEDVEALAATAVDAFGGVHLVCNNAGVDSGAPFSEISQETWDWVLGVNLHGVLNGCRVFLPLLREQPEGHIVNTSSMVGLTGFLPTGTPYAVSKFAVLGLSEMLCHELALAGDTVGVSVLCPGAVDTRMPDAERNLPPGVPPMATHPARAALIEVLRRGGVEGLSPAQVAEDVVTAVRERRFFVLPHRDEALAAVEARLAWMRSGERPPYGGA